MKQTFFEFHSLNVRRTFGFGAMALALAILPACSDDDLSNNGTSPDVDMETSNVTIGNDPEAQAHRITFYGKSGRASRAASDFPSIGKEPSIPEGTSSFSTPNEAQQSNDESKKQAYILTGGKDQIDLYGEKSTVYITGNVSTHNINGQGTIYVMKGGSLTLSDGFNNQGAKIYAFGDLIASGGITLGSSGSILVDNNFKVNGRFAVEGTCVVRNELVVTRGLQMNSSARVKAKCIYVDGDNETEPTINMGSGSELSVQNYLSTRYLYMNGGGTVYLYPYAMAQTEKTKMTSDNCKFEYYSSEGKKEHALLDTDVLEVEGSADNVEFIKGMFANELKVDYESITKHQPANDFTAVPSAKDYFIPSTVNHGGCNPGHGTDKPTFDNVVDIESPEHAHTHLSATCVQWANNVAYVSYHLNEAYTDEDVTGPVGTDGDHQGCIEVIEVNETSAQITSWMMDNTFDINHTIVDDNKIFMTGDNKAGGQLGVIDLTAGKFTEDKGTISLARLNGGSGNCIVRNDDYYIIAAYDGFQTAKVENGEDGKPVCKDVEGHSFITTTGSAKHIAKNGSMIATLNLDSKESTSSATVSIYNPWGMKSTSFSVGTITPINGKNVIALEDNSIYVCLGENGVAKFDFNGQNLGQYNWIEKHPETKGRPCANGLAVDDKYLYVAYGGVGLVVFDKITMERVARYYHTSEENTEYSANYVALVNDYIYVAYGRNGLEILKMREPVNYGK